MTAGDEVLLYKNIYMYIYSYSPWAFFQDYMYCQDENKEKEKAVLPVTCIFLHDHKARPHHHLGVRLK